MTNRGNAELSKLLGEDGLAQLAEEFGGTRLYVPFVVEDDHRIVQAIGSAAARKLCARYAPDCLRVPLARDIRAPRYRAAGDSNAQIARKLGMTETAVEKLFARLAAVGDPLC